LRICAWGLRRGSATPRVRAHADAGLIRIRRASAFDDKSTLIAWLPWDAVFDGIRADARYSAMVARLGVQLNPNTPSL
jgi:hypothetical protein